MMNIFHHFKLVEGKGIMYQNIRAVQDKYISPPNIKKIPELINNLITQGYITYEKKTSNWFFLTKKGEDYLYGNKLNERESQSNHKQIIINNPKNVAIDSSGFSQNHTEELSVPFY